MSLRHANGGDRYIGFDLDFQVDKKNTINLCNQVFPAFEKAYEIKLNLCKKHVFGTNKQPLNNN